MVTQAAPHYLIADGPPLAVRRTRGGDAWQARRDGMAGTAAGDSAAALPVLLGMPAVGRPGS
jgi:tRNA-2-methylthio-N6-dimethylallyladenosine synthase